MPHWVRSVVLWLVAGSIPAAAIAGTTTGEVAISVTVVKPHVAWDWHGGTIWAPQSAYWGGGFWGNIAPAAIDGAASASATNVASPASAFVPASRPSYPASYAVSPSSPGSMLLDKYHLRQTPCGANVVVIDYFGSVVCAAPNASVGAGIYAVNLAMLALVPQ
jgi:hypothetical protein